MSIAPVRNETALASEGTPRYLGAYNSILDTIRRGLLKPGDRLPPELELARTLRVSLGTAQKALRMLADRGLIVREKGRGTFVTGGRTPGKDEQIRNFRFLDDDSQTLLPIYTRVLAINEVVKEQRLADVFPEADSMVCITRTISVNFEFQLYSRLFLPTNFFRSLLDFKLDELAGTPLTHYLGEHFNVPVVRSIHRIIACVLPDDVCSEIGASAGTTGTEWEIIGMTYRNVPVSYQHVYMPPHRRRLELRDTVSS